MIYNYSGYGIEFDVKSIFGFPTTGLDRKVINFRVNMSLFAHIDNKKIYILILRKSPRQGLDDITPTAEKICSINFTEHNQKFYLSLHHNGASNYYLSIVQKLSNLKQ